MDVIVIGGGIVGVATAYQLRAAGHRVCVVERYATVAQGATYGQAAPSCRRRSTSGSDRPSCSRQAAKNGVIRKTGFNGAARLFERQLAAWQEPQAFSRQFGLLRPLIEASRDAMADIEARFGLEFEQANGVLYLARSPQEWQLTQPALECYAIMKCHTTYLRRPSARTFEHSVPTDPEFAGGVLFDQERTANCPLFTKLVKQTLDTQGGVQFMLNREVEAIRLEGHARRSNSRRGSAKSPRRVKST